MTYPKTPTLDRMLAVKEKSQVIGEFLEWLTTDRAVVLAKWYENNCLWHLQCSIESLLADYFDIDLKEAENEKRQILETLNK